MIRISEKKISDVIALQSIKAMHLFMHLRYNIAITAPHFSCGVNVKCYIALCFLSLAWKLFARLPQKSLLYISCLSANLEHKQISPKPEPYS